MCWGTDPGHGHVPGSLPGTLKRGATGSAGTSTAQAGGFYVGFYLSTDTAITTADTKIGEWYSPGLGAGVLSSLQQTPITIPASVPAGTYYIGSILDTTNAVTEGNELNNLVPSSSLRWCCPTPW